MFNVAVVEKVEEKRKDIVSALMKSKNGFNVQVFPTEKSFLISSLKVRSYFDIYLINPTLSENGDGIKLAQVVRSTHPQAMIALITDSTEWYSAAFSFYADGYLLYPMDTESLQRCITAYCLKIQKERRSTISIKVAEGGRLTVYTRHITYVESDNRSLYIHMEDGSVIRSCGRLSDLQQELPEDQFFRCHRSYLVNVFFIESYRRYSLIIDGNEIPISKKYSGEVGKLPH